MKLTPVPRRLPAGSEIVLVDGVEALWHLPKRTGGAFQQPTLCGLAGTTYAYGPWLDRRCCAVCGDRAPRGTFLEPRKPRRRGKRRLPELTAAQLQVLHRTYLDANIGIPSLAKLVWRRLGFPNEVSCHNAIHRAFTEHGLKIRARNESHRRTNTGRRLLGYGRGRKGGRRLDARTIDRLWSLYEAGWSVPKISERMYRRFAYPDVVAFRSVLEYAWRSSGKRMRTNREAELLSRSQMTRCCVAMTTGAAGCRPRPCTQRPLDGSDYCLHHDPDHQEEVLARAAALRARKVLKPKVPWTAVLPHLAPLLVPRPDRFGRQLEQASGALARNTGIDPGICSRYLKGQHELITVDYANKFLAPLGVTVAELLQDVAA